MLVLLCVLSEVVALMVWFLNKEQLTRFAKSFPVSVILIFLCPLIPHAKDVIANQLGQTKY